MTPPGTPALYVDNLSIRFDGRTVLDALGFELPAGAKATITGPSGAGKSTILRCILGFTLPDEGEIRIDGERLTAASVWTLRARLAYVAQEPVIGEGTVREVLERPFSYRVNANARANLDQAPALFERFLLPRQHMDKDVESLSGGEKQRVAIISSILLGRRIFLLDEASSALDPDARQAVMDYFRAQDALTVLAVSHAPETFGFPERIIALPGRNGQEGRP